MSQCVRLSAKAEEEFINPKVSVVMAVHNGEKYLREAVDSILTQTFTDFEFIIVDDASIDRSAEIISTYKDPRIRFIRSDRHLGHATCLNRGLDVALGEYVARMDCDDISLPERLTRQVAFMDANPNVGACGTWAQNIDETGKVVGRRETPVGEELDNFYWRMSPLIHPAAMFRFGKSSDLRYDGAIDHCEDYDLWWRIRAKQKLSNLSEHLLLYRIHENSVTSKYAEAQGKIAYGAFCRHVGTRAISYGAFLALMWQSYDLNPFSRALAMMRLAKSIRKSYRLFFNDDLQYARRWLHSQRIYKAAFGTQGFRAFFNTIMRLGLQKRQS
jgi:glycosyltransferase involved in cell wall biosynthesis